MSSWGRSQDAVLDVLWGYDDGYGNFHPGLLHDLGWERVHALVEPLVEAMYPIAFDIGLMVGRGTDA